MTGTASPSRCDVAVVGYGPVGAVLANLLGQRGVDVMVFEPAAEVYQLPRAIHFDGEIMRVFETLGLAEEMLRATTPVLGMDFVTADGSTLFGFAAQDRPRHHGWEAGYMFRQPELEAVLRAGVERFPSVRVRLSHEVTGLVVDVDHADLEVTGPGRGETVRARYVVGCDGARSFVRKALGVELDDGGFDQPWLVVDTRLVDGAEVALPDRVLQICDPARPATFVPSVGRHRRWELMAMGAETAEELLDPATVARLLRPWVTVGRDVEVERTAVYSFHALVARQWRCGPVFLAGDAAHQMPPFLGQGMCSGVRDAANLAWKLDMVLRGAAGDRLLDTYQPEREPHVRAITDLAVSLGGLLQTTDPAVAAARDEGFRTNGDHSGDALGPPEVDLPPLRHGLVHGDGRAVGRPFPQPCPGDDEALGGGFAVVGPLAERAGIEALRGRAVVRPGATTAVVRPDRYTFATAHDEAELASAMAALHAQLA